MNITQQIQDLQKQQAQIEEQIIQLQTQKEQEDLANNQLLYEKNKPKILNFYDKIQTNYQIGQQITLEEQDDYFELIVPSFITYVINKNYPRINQLLYRISKKLDLLDELIKHNYKPYNLQNDMFYLTLQQHLNKIPIRIEIQAKQDGSYVMETTYQGLVHNKSSMVNSKFKQLKGTSRTSVFNLVQTKTYSNVHDIIQEIIHLDKQTTVDVTFEL